jgi:chemotaxis protein MotB
MAIPKINDSARIFCDALAAVQPEPKPILRKVQRGSIGKGLFDGSDTFLDDGLMRSNWAVPWSDLMMTMFVLFAALLAVQGMQAHAKNQQAHQTTAVLQQLQPANGEVISHQADLDPPMHIDVLARSEEAVRETNLKNAEIVLLNDQSVKVSVQGPMFFALGKADLRPEIMQFLDRLAQIIKQTPYEIHVIGHTDDRPINTTTFPSNWELSLVRASHVARFLISSGDIDPSRFVVMGRGQYEPAATNTDDRRRAFNRRVEIIITRKVSGPEGEHRQ